MEVNILPYIEFLPCVEYSSISSCTYLKTKDLDDNTFFKLQYSTQCDEQKYLETQPQFDHCHEPEYICSSKTEIQLAVMNDELEH